jgi:GDPmannose 4,6-dehydratase
VPRIGFRALVEEMMREDLKEAERDALCAHEGYRVLQRYE